jgi:hypothetical protein
MYCQVSQQVIGPAFTTDQAGSLTGVLDPVSPFTEALGARLAGENYKNNLRRRPLTAPGLRPPTLSTHLRS